ncbi:MAG: aminotransferase class IV [Chitinophagaceae bacterium]|nr:aminotransferase class IV [Chitinophagaceae bacterium]
MPGGYFVHNGQLFREGKAVISPDNRSFRYGDGLFETMRIIKGNIPLKKFHFERLLSGMKLLQFDIPEFFTPANLESDIIALSKKNRIEDGAVIRLVVFRSEGGLYDLEDMRPNYIIQSMALGNIPSLNDDGQGIEIDVYPDATKACNVFSSVKSNNFLPYFMGVLYAKQKGLGDCLILNQYGRIADATVANIFCVKGKTIYTPPLSEGGVAGVARRFLMEYLPQGGYELEEKAMAADELQQMDEVFLTNAVRGIRSVKKFRNKTYSSAITKAVQKLWLEKAV